MSSNNLDSLFGSVIAFGAIVGGVVAWKRQFGVDPVAENSSNTKASPFPLLRHLSTFSNWSDYSEDQERFIQEVPKIELHVVRAEFRAIGIIP